MNLLRFFKRPAPAEQCRLADLQLPSAQRALEHLHEAQALIDEAEASHWRPLSESRAGVLLVTTRAELDLIVPEAQATVHALLEGIVVEDTAEAESESLAIKVAALCEIIDDQ